MQPNDQQPSTDGNDTTPTEQTTNPNNVEQTPIPTNGETIAPTAPVKTSASPVVTSETGTATDTTEPVVSAPVTNNAVAPVAPKKRFSKKMKLLALAIIVAIVLIGGTAGAYFGIIVPSQPQRIVGDSLSNTLNSDKTKSVKFEGELNCVSGDSCKSFSLATFKGSLKEKGTFDLNIQLKTAVTSIGLDARSVGDKSLYLRLSGLEGLDKLLNSFAGDDSSSSMTSQYASIISKINNQWYTIDESLLKQAGGDISLPTEGNTLSKDDAKKIGEAYKKHQFISVDKKLADEKIHNQSSYHLQVKIDKAQLKSFATEVKNININGVKIDQKDIDELDKVDFSKYPFDIWVSKSNRMIDQIATTITQDGTTVKVRIAAYDYNEPVTIEKPQGAKSVLELVSEFAPLYSGGVQGANSENPLSLLGL
jgi:hypothetical protein